MLSTVAKIAQNPNIRIANKTAAEIGRSNADGLGRKQGTFEEQIDFVSNSGFNLPGARVEHSQPDSEYRVVKGNKVVKSDTYCQHIADMNPESQENCRHHCDYALLDPHIGISVEYDISDFSIIDYSLRKIDPKHIEITFEKKENVTDTRAMQVERNFQKARTKCSLLSIAGMKDVDHIGLCLWYFNSIEYQMIENIVKISEDLWLGENVAPRMFDDETDTPLNAMIFMMDSPFEKWFCKSFEPQYYVTYERQSQYEYSDVYSQFKSTSYTTIDELLFEMRRVLLMFSNRTKKETMSAPFCLKMMPIVETPI